MSLKVNSKKLDPLKVCISFEHLSNDILNLLWKRLRIGWVNNAQTIFKSRTNKCLGEYN